MSSNGSGLCKLGLNLEQKMLSKSLARLETFSSGEWYVIIIAFLFQGLVSIWSRTELMWLQSIYHVFKGNDPVLYCKFGWSVTVIKKMRMSTVKQGKGCYDFLASVSVISLSIH